MKRLFTTGMLLLSAAFLFNACAPKQDAGKVQFLDREVDVASFLTGFPYSTYGFHLSQEANPAAGLISDDSPFGSAMLGRVKGDTVTVAAPAGELRFEILSVERSV